MSELESGWFARKRESCQKHVEWWFVHSFTVPFLQPTMLLINPYVLLSSLEAMQEHLVAILQPWCFHETSKLLPDWAEINETAWRIQICGSNTQLSESPCTTPCYGNCVCARTLPTLVNRRIFKASGDRLLHALQHALLLLIYMNI